MNYKKLLKSKNTKLLFGEVIFSLRNNIFKNPNSQIYKN